MVYLDRVFVIVYLKVKYLCAMFDKFQHKYISIYINKINPTTHLRLAHWFSLRYWSKLNRKQYPLLKQKYN